MAAHAAISDDATAAAVVVHVASADDGGALGGVRLVGTLSSLSQMHGERPIAAEGGLNTTVVTDELGQARFAFPGGDEYLIHAWGRPESAVRARLEPGEQRSTSLWLRTSADLELAVRVLDAEMGTLLPNAQIAVRNLDRNGVPVRNATATARTDEHGLALLRVPSWLDLDARVSCEGYGDRLATLHRVEAAVSADVLLFRCARLEGRVMDAKGAPAAGLLVVVGGPDFVTDESMPGSNISKRWWRGTSDSEGKYCIDGIHSNVDLSVDVYQQGLRRLRIPRGLQLEPGQVHVKDLQLEPEFQLEPGF